MERFKIVERETKTKAYSKEGLTSGQRLDPAERERCEISQWLNSCLETLNIQIDQFEAEIENLGTTKKKKGRGGQQEQADQIEALNTLLEKHRDHVQKLETLLRMLDNDTVDINQIKDIKDDLEYYIENCQDPDFMENDMLYEDIDGLEEMLLDVSNVNVLSLLTLTAWGRAMIRIDNFWQSWIQMSILQVFKFKSIEAPIFRTLFNYVEC